MGFLTGSAKKRGWSDDEQKAEDEKQRNLGAGQGVGQGPTGFTRREYDGGQFGGGGRDVLYDEANPGGKAVGEGSGTKEAARYRSLGEEAAGRSAYKVNFDLAQGDRTNSLTARGQQVDASNMQRDAAMGLAPSRAAIMGNQVAGQSLEAAMAGGAGARGLGAAAAQSMSARGMGGAQMGGTIQAMGMRGNEINTARSEYTDGLAGIRAGDYANMKLSQEQAEAQAKSEIAQRHLNQSGQMGYDQMNLNVKQAELDASIRRAAVQNAQNATAQAEHDANKARAMKTYQAGAGAITTIGTGSDERLKQNARKLSFSDAHAKREAYLLGRSQAGGGKDEALAKAWDEGHSTAIANVQKVAGMSAAELKAKEKDHPEAAAVKAIKAQAWDEGNRTAGEVIASRPKARDPMTFKRERPPEGAMQRGMAALAAHPYAMVGSPLAAADVAYDAYVGAEGKAADAGQRTLSDGRTKGKVVSLYEEPGTEKHWDADVSAAPDMMSGASLAGPSPKYSHGEAPKRGGLAAASPKARKTSDADLKRMADEMLGTQQAQTRASLDSGPSVKGDAMGKALADMQPYEYEYKPEYGGHEGQQPGEKNVGPMAQDMAKNPITGSAVIQRPDGMLAVDMTKAGKLSLGAIGYLAAKQRDQDDEIRRLKKGRA